MLNSGLLRFALLADAVATAATGLLMFAAAGALAPWLGLPDSLLRYAGLPLLPYAALVGFLGTRARVAKPFIWAIIIGNALWTVDSLALLLTGWVAPTGLGYAFVIGQAVAVAVFAELQYVGLQRATQKREMMIENLVIS